MMNKVCCIFVFAILLFSVCNGVAQEKAVKPEKNTPQTNIEKTFEKIENLSAADLSTSCILKVKKFMKKYPDRHPWVRIPDGVIYKGIFKGTGKDVKPGVAVHTQVRGYQEDGVQFENTFQKDEWAIFTYGRKGQVIDGFQSGIWGMKEGGKRIMIIPPELAYGERGFKEDDVHIKPGETIILDCSIMWIREPEFDKLDLFR